jgi:hypothetical protein
MVFSYEKNMLIRFWHSDCHLIMQERNCMDNEKKTLDIPKTWEHYNCYTEVILE